MTGGGRRSPPPREFGGCQSGGVAGLMRGSGGTAGSSSGNNDLVGVVEANGVAIARGEVGLTGRVYWRQFFVGDDVRPADRGNPAMADAVDASSAAVGSSAVGLSVKERVSALASSIPAVRKEMAQEMSPGLCMAGMHGTVHAVNNKVAGD